MKQILRYPFFYNLYQNMVGSKGFQKRFVETFIEPKIQEDTSILDFGCGTGNVVEFLPKNIKYTGIDVSDLYIKYASKKYPNHNFVCQNANEDIDLNKKFNIILSEAVMVSLSDSDAEKMFCTMKKHADKNCKIILSDMHYAQSNSCIENFFLKNERGHNIRNREQFTNLIEKYFKIDNVTVMKKVYRIPYSKIVFECSLPM